MANSWDFPTYLGLTGAAVLLAELLRTRLDWKTSIGRAVVLAAITVVMLMTLVTLLAAGPLLRLIGDKIESVITRILGVILAALAAQFVIDGLRQSFPALT